MRVISSLFLALALPATLSAQVGLHWEQPDPKPASQNGQDAISQLEALTGQKIDRSQVATSFRPPVSRPKPRAPQGLSVNQQISVMLLGGILENLFAQALQPTAPAGPDPAEQARLAAQQQEALRRQQAELQAWAQAYSARMNALVEHQRQQRAAQNQQSLEGLRASLSDGWDSGKPAGGGGDLASALSDPFPTAVDLRGSLTYTPSLLREANGTKRTSPITADDLLKRREAAQARLKAMMAENGDLRLLGQRFYELEAELDRLKHQARGLGSDGRALQREMDYWGWRIEQATQACMERGTSLFTDVLLPMGTSAGLKRLQKNPKLWGPTLQSLSGINDFTEFTGGLMDRYDAAGQALDWIQAKRNLMKDVDFIATNIQHLSSKLEPVGLHWQVGKILVGTSVDLAAELDGWGAILEGQGDAALILQKQKAIQVRLEALVSNLQASRALIATRLGVKPEDLIPPGSHSRGLGSTVPPL